MEMKLKPCPFCGKEVKIQGGPEDWKPSLVDPDSGGDPYQITCECGCCFGLFNYDAEELANAWNERATIQCCTREKLIELLGLPLPSNVPNQLGSYDTIGERTVRLADRERLADHIIENCVTAPSYKAGDTVYVIEYDDDGVAEDYTGYMFLAQTTNAVIVTPFINDYDSDQTVEYHIQETVESMDTDLCVFPLEYCYATQEEAQKVLRESGVDNG